MSFEKALESVGATCVKSEERGKQRILYLRISENYGEIWAETVRKFLIDSVGGAAVIDLSKSFYPEGNNVKFLWRLVVAGDIKEGIALFIRSARLTVSPPVELDSQPLVGRITYEFDPKRGKMKGAHPQGQAEMMISSTGR